MGTRSDRRFRPGSPACRRYRMKTSRQPNRIQPTANDETRSRIDKSVLALPGAQAAARQDSTYALWPSSPASSAAASPATRTICALRSRADLAQKVSDEFTVPLCRAHHRELHRAGKEGDWWSRTGFEPLNSARRLWLETHPLAISASPADGDGAAAETKLATDENEATAIPQRRRMESTKRIQLPGTPK